MTVDYETFYSKTHSLSKLPTEEYINSDEFEVIGLSIKLGDSPAAWYTGTRLEIMEVLTQFNWSEIALVAHNCFFDASILSLYYGITPAKYIDTLSMARAVHGISVGGSLAKLAEYYELGVKGTEVVNALGKHLKDFSPTELAAYGEYCVNDTELAYLLCQKLLPQFSMTELELISLTIKMGVEPLLEVDLPALENHLYQVKAAKEELLNKIVVDKTEIMSNPKFAKLLEGCGVQVPMKVSPTTGKLTYAFAKTDDGLKDLLEHPNLLVQTLVAVRLGVKSTIEETRTERFIGIAKRMGILPIPLKYYGTATGRWAAGGGQKVNFQNIPRDSKIKEAIVAPEGYLIVGADLSNIELRVGLWVAGETEALRLLGEGGDLYKEFASKAFNVPYDEVTKAQRFIGKTCLAEGTLVLCESGWKPIEAVSMNDRVWDGEEWVCHLGLVTNGLKETLEICGVWLTPDHLVWLGQKWIRADQVGSTGCDLSQVLGAGSEKLPLQGMCWEQEGTTIGTNGESMILKRRIPVYDLNSVGTRNRFTVLTDRGPIIVHNCQLGLIFGVGHPKLQASIKAQSGTDLGEVESKRIVDLYRSTYTGITGLWKTCGEAIKAIAEDKEYTFGPNDLYKVEGKKGIRFPSGLYMQYPLLANVIDEKTGEQGYKYKLRNGYDRLYGGKLTNNLVQGTARCLMAEAAIRISKKYPIVLTVHDSVYCVVLEQEAPEAYEFMCKELTKPPQWMPTIPLGAEGGWGKTLKEAG